LLNGNLMEPVGRCEYLLATAIRHQADIAGQTPSPEKHYRQKDMEMKQC
jgi:hypothetical protein